jgi:hypothetical protein
MRLYISPSHATFKRSEFSIRGLHRLLLVCSLLRNLLVASPVHSLQALRQDGVRVVEAGVEPIGVHARQVLNLQLDERGSELARVAELDGKSIYTMLAGS